MTSLNPYTGPQNLTSVNNSVLSVAGTVKLNIKLGNLGLTPLQLYSRGTVKLLSHWISIH